MKRTDFVPWRNAPYNEVLLEGRRAPFEFVRGPKSDMLDVDSIRLDFPVLQQQVNGRPLAFLDSAASSQKPLAVIEAMDEYYRHDHANVHRGVYDLSERATAAYETARKKMARFINAANWREVLFTRNATEAINLVAYTWGQQNIKAGDVILLTEMEHHANLVPWQQLAGRTGAQLAFVPVTDAGGLDMDAYDRLLNGAVKLVAFTQMSNVLGTISPAKALTGKAHAAGAIVLMDGAQGVPHVATDVQDLDVDFLAVSGHKMLGPTGSGVLYGKRRLLEAMPPFLTGGEMVRQVSFETASWNEIPWKFEAGTPAIAEAVGLGAAADYLTRLDMAAVRRHDMDLVAYALNRLQEVEGFRFYGPADPEQRGGALAFNLGDVHPHDLASTLNDEGIAIRAGHHCAMPLHTRLGLQASARASFYVYNTFAEIDRLAHGLEKAHHIFDR